MLLFINEDARPVDLFDLLAEKLEVGHSALPLRGQVHALHKVASSFRAKLSTQNVHHDRYCMQESCIPKPNGMFNDHLEVFKNIKLLIKYSSEEP